MPMENNCFSSCKVLRVNWEIWVCASVPGDKKETETEP